MHKKLLYTRYVNYILIVYHTIRTHQNSINSHINQIHNNKNLTPHMKQRVYKFPWQVCNPKSNKHWIWHIPETNHHRHINSLLKPPHWIQSGGFWMSHRQNALYLINTKKTKRGINTTNSQKQQLPTKYSTEIKPTNTTKNQIC